MAIPKSARIGVLMGGLSSERRISEKSGKAVCQALVDGGWNAIPISVGRDLPEQLAGEKIDVAWIALHGRFGEDGCVQGLLEVLGIPYTGSGVRASAIAMDKIATKHALLGVEHIQLARDVVVRRGDDIPTHLPFPLVVKPSVGGSTVGITLAKDPEALSVGIKQALLFHHEVLIEECIVGDEITVAVLNQRPYPVIRIIPHSGFFDFEAKYTDGMTHYEVPAQIDSGIASHAQNAAVAAYDRLGCRGLVRADFMVDKVRGPIFLEINTLPGMTATSLSPMAVGESGMSFQALVESILNGAECMPEETETGN